MLQAECGSLSWKWAHALLIKGCLSTVVSAPWSTVDWPWPKRVELVRVGWSPLKKKIKRGMGGWFENLKQLFGKNTPSTTQVFLAWWIETRQVEFRRWAPVQQHTSDRCYGYKHQGSGKNHQGRSKQYHSRDSGVLASERQRPYRYCTTIFISESDV